MTIPATLTVDPFMVRDRRLILLPLVLSHHHPVHAWHLGPFPRALVHDVWPATRETS